jgi:hypothetical protein
MAEASVAERTPEGTAREAQPARPVRRCAGCGERAGSISARTGRPLVGKPGGPFYHVNCTPGAAARWAMVERMGA